ncbi:MAG: tyrosine-type recombinase/integrase [Lachnospiraceae bacterium]|nr:tyrosine-type recombinase/integrase [Lachnospiraceae bacterium]
MNNLQTNIKNYLNYCQSQKRLDTKTLKAYRIDLKQFGRHIPTTNITAITSDMLEIYIANLHQNFAPKTVKRKIASTKAFFHYLELKERIERNPFHKIDIKFREPVTLPKTISLHTVETFLATIYQQQQTAATEYQRRNALRDAAVIETLFATGIRISELCSLKTHDIDLHDYSVLIYGKGSKERKVQIGSPDVIAVLTKYRDTFQAEIQHCDHFFANQNGTPLSDQSVRRMIRKYTNLASIELHITPHMFRHTFATSLLEADVDIRYIQEMLGHSSIHITEIYTHVAMAKQRDILTNKHPRKNLKI